MPTAPGKGAHHPPVCVLTSVYVVFHCTDGLNMEVKFPLCGTNKGLLISTWARKSPNLAGRWPSRTRTEEPSVLTSRWILHSRVTACIRHTNQLWWYMFNKCSYLKYRWPNILPCWPIMQCLWWAKAQKMKQYINKKGGLLLNRNLDFKMLFCNILLFSY